MGDLRKNAELPAGKRDGTGLAFTDFEAEGVEGDLKLRRCSDQHSNPRLNVRVPLEFERDRHDCLGNNAKANVSKTCCVNV